MDKAYCIRCTRQGNFLLGKSLAYHREKKIVSKELYLVRDYIQNVIQNPFPNAKHIKDAMDLFLTCMKM